MMGRALVVALIAAFAWSAVPAHAQQTPPKSAEKKAQPAAKKAPEKAAEKAPEKTPEKKPGEQHIGRFGDWDVFTATEGKGRVCYMATLAKGEGARRPYVLVMHRPAQKSLGVVSVTALQPYKDKSEAEAEVGVEKFALYTSAKTPDTAWAFDDAKLLQAMLKGNALVVRSTPAKGAAATDSFSLDGMSKAYAELNKACGVK
jgi:invasion protein IalB